MFIFRFFCLEVVSAPALDGRWGPFSTHDEPITLDISVSGRLQEASEAACDGLTLGGPPQRLCCRLTLSIMLDNSRGNQLYFEQRHLTICLKRARQSETERAVGTPWLPPFRFSRLVALASVRSVLVILGSQAACGQLSSVGLKAREGGLGMRRVFRPMKPAVKLLSC